MLWASFCTKLDPELEWLLLLDAARKNPGPNRQVTRMQEVVRYTTLCQASTCNSWQQLQEGAGRLHKSLPTGFTLNVHLINSLASAALSDFLVLNPTTGARKKKKRRGVKRARCHDHDETYGKQHDSANIQMTAFSQTCYLNHLLLFQTSRAARTRPQYCSNFNRLTPVQIVLKWC